MRFGQKSMGLAKYYGTTNAFSKYNGHFRHFSRVRYGKSGKSVKDGLSNDTIDSHPTEADAVGDGIGAERSFAGISLRIAAFAGVLDVQSAAAARAAEQARQQGLTASDGTATHIALSIGVVGDQVLVPFELGPRNISLMVIMDQNFPHLPITSEVVAHDPLPTALDRHARPSPAVGVRASVHRVRQNVMQRMVNWRLPFDWASSATLHDCRDEDIFLPEPKQDLAD
jgi:hypothetical protein